MRTAFVTRSYKGGVLSAPLCRKRQRHFWSPHEVLDYEVSWASAEKVQTKLDIYAAVAPETIRKFSS